MHIGTVFTLILLSIILIAYIAQPFLNEEADRSGEPGKPSNETTRNKAHNPSIICQSCGTYLHAQDRYCPQCGAEIRKIK